MDGKAVLVANNEGDFAEAMNIALSTGDTIAAPEKLGRLFGFPVDVPEDVGDLEDLEPGPFGPGSAYLLPGDEES